MSALIRAASIEELSVSGPGSLAVTVGNFDGVHRGHQSVLAEFLRVAAERDRTGVVATFDPHPLSVVAPERAPRLLTPIDERLELLEAAGVQTVVVVPFTAELAATDGETFLKGVGVGAGSVVVLGYDFHMGRDRASGINSLKALSSRLAFDLNIVPPVFSGAEAISSSRIRTAVARGDICDAGDMLGRPYVIRGAVARGDGIGGPLLGVPTANLKMPARKLLPSDGVYYVECAPGRRPGVLYVGRRPTFGSGGLRVEVHLLDVEEELYGTSVSVEVFERLRGDESFGDVDALRDQIGRDLERARVMAVSRGENAGRAASDG